jgi:hypothetical protein
MTEEKKNGELVPIERTLSQRIADAEGGIEAINKLRLAALKLLKPRSVIDQQGHPYIKSNAASLIGRLFGVEVVNAKWEPQETINHSDGFPDEMVFKVTGECIFEGKSFPVSGVSTTRDKFFGKKTVDGQKVFKQYDEIDFPSLMMKAFTRMNGAAARAALDLNTIDWDEIQRVTGIKKSSVESVEYRGGSKSKKELTPENQTKLGEIKKMAIYLTQGSAELEGDLLLSVTANPAKGFKGTSDYNRLSDAQVSWIHREYEKRQKKQMETEANPPGAKQ